MKNEIEKKIEEFLNGIKKYIEEKEEFIEYSEHIKKRIKNIFDTVNEEEKKMEFLKELQIINEKFVTHIKIYNLQDKKADEYKKTIDSILNSEFEMAKKYSEMYSQSLSKLCEAEEIVSQTKDWRNYLIKKIVSGVSVDFYNIQDLLNNFLENDFQEAEKEKVLELLYLYNIYINGYISLDSRVREKKKFNSIYRILNARNVEELNEGINNLEEFIKELKYAEEHPIETAKKIAREKIIFKNVIF